MAFWWGPLAKSSCRLQTTAGKPGKQQVTIQPAVEGLTNSLLHVGKNSEKLGKPKWGCIKTNLAIFGGMNIHLPVIWGSLGYQGFDSYPNVKKNRRKSPENSSENCNVEFIPSQVDPMLLVPLGHKPTMWSF